MGSIPMPEAKLYRVNGLQVTLGPNTKQFNMCVTRQINLGNPVHKPAARRRFDEICKVANENAGFIEVVRGDKTFQRKVKAISDGAQSTGKALIQSYAEFLREQIMKLPVDYYRTGNLPPFLTNSERLARFRQNVTGRTIRNHMRELKAIGLISSYKFRGSSRDYEIQLNPEVIWGEEGRKVEPKNEAAGVVAESTNGINFPHKQPIETHGNKDIDTGNEEKSCLYGNENGNNDGNKLPGLNELTDCQSPTEKPSPENGNKGGAGAGRVVVDNSKKVWKTQDGVWISGENGRIYDGLSWKHRYLVDQFWQHAKNTVYRGKVWQRFEELEALEAITVGVYVPFWGQEPDDRLVRRFQEEILKSLDVADKYYQRHTDKYPGLPYSVHVQGKGYFDAENEYGFNAAKAFRKENWRENKRQAAEKTVSLALWHIAAHKKGRAPKKLQAMDFAQVVAYYQRKIEKLPANFQMDFYSRFRM